MLYPGGICLFVILLLQCCRQQIPDAAMVHQHKGRYRGNVEVGDGIPDLCRALGVKFFGYFHTAFGPLDLALPDQVFGQLCQPLDLVVHVFVTLAFHEKFN